ncbi:testis-expressed protein 2-like isoform X1 [Diadema setosum]|uniref:testis-expressed protein 2-like isoform X1 n=1 Tax=Diadema setosum TaxID=31175 RepID=UPI003B3A7E11
MSSDRKPKPPRPAAPPAPKKSVKKQASSGLSFSFNDLKAVDSDDEEKSFARSTRPDTQESMHNSRRDKELKPLSSANHDTKVKELKPLSHPSSESGKSGELKSFGSLDRNSVDCGYEVLDHPFASRSVEAPRPVVQVQKVQEEIQRSSPPKAGVETDRKEDQNAAKGKPKLKKGGSGVLKVATEVLEENENDILRLPADSQEALADPLSFLDKVMEDQLGSSFDDDDDSGSKSHLRRRRESGNARKKDLHQHRAKSLDADFRHNSEKVVNGDNSLDINPCYFNVPTPSELKDDPVRKSESGANSKKSQAKVISLSGLLSNPDNSEVDGETQSIRTNSDGVRTPDVPPDETDWVKIERKPQQDTSSPPTSSSRAQSPEEERNAVLEEPSVSLPALPIYTLSTLTLAMFGYYLFPLPTYLSGFLTGLLCAFYLVLFLIWLNLPARDKFYEEEAGTEVDTPLVIPGPRQTAAKIRKEQEKVVLKGWMNELTVAYDPETYNVNQTHSIFVRLEGHTLRLSRPKQNIARRAMFDEPTPKPEFIHQRIYDIRGSNVYLQPDGLVKKRLWSKKYPLFIELPKKGLSVEKKDISPPDDGVAQGLGFDVIKNEECDDKVLILFARTSREKEEWFWKFEAASTSQKNRIRPIQTLQKKVFLIGNDFIGEDGNPIYRDPEDITSRKAMVDFFKFLAKIMPKEKDVKDTLVQDIKAKAGGVTYASPGRRPAKGNLEREGSIQGGVSNDTPVAWLNAFVGRFFWDFLREEQWAEIVQAKLQKKLSKLKIPHFMDALTITETDLGLNAPTVRRVSRPTVDSRGMWMDVEIHYGGSCWMTLTTKFNLWKLGKDTRMEREMEDMMAGKKEGIEKLERRQMSAALYSDEEDSGESSDDEVAEENISTAASETSIMGGEEGVKSSSKIMRFVNKVANSNYFQRATQNKYIRRAFDEVSNTSVELTVEVKELRGVLAVNIPPPPSDRLWYGFRGKPHLWLSAKPKLGTRQVTITHISEYIERKLEKEFQVTMGTKLIDYFYPPPPPKKKKKKKKKSLHMPYIMGGFYFRKICESSDIRECKNT